MFGGVIFVESVECFSPGSGDILVHIFILRSWGEGGMTGGRSKHQQERRLILGFVFVTKKSERSSSDHICQVVFAVIISMNHLLAID